MKWMYLFISILAEVVGTSALKAAEGFTKWVPSLIVVVGYGVAFYFLSVSLKSIPMGIGYAIWSGVGIVLISLIGYFVYKQALDWPAVIGIALILVGVLVIQLFSAAAAHE
jgi:small multidrug resistance pump